MKFVRSILSVAVAAAFSVTCLAQQPATGYHTVACLKVKADKGSEFRKWAAEDLHKYAQSRLDAGFVTTWYLLRSVMPQGESAECDYLVVAMYPAAPPKPLGVEDLDAALKKAGIAMNSLLSGTPAPLLILAVAALAWFLHRSIGLVAFIVAALLFIMLQRGHRSEFACHAV